MSSKRKVHLEIPRTGGSLCGCYKPLLRSEDPNFTMEPTLATCKLCILAYPYHKKWYPSAAARLTKFVEDYTKSSIVSADLFRRAMGMSTKYQLCDNCGKSIRVMAFQGTNHCSENCRKDLEKANAS